MSATDVRPAVSRASWLTLVAMTGSLAMIMLDQTVVTVALPTMARDLSLGASAQQWVVNAYVLAMAAAVALGGKLGSKLGPVTTFRIGVSVFFAASAACGLAPAADLGATWLIVARVVQGLGAALMMPVSATIVMAAFPESMRGRAMGTYVGISQLFLALGPLVGGILTEWASWRLVFWLNVPVGLLSLYLVHRVRPANPQRHDLGIRPMAVAMLMTGIGTTVYALQQSTTWGWGSTRTAVLLAGGLLVLTAFVWGELRSLEPLVQVRLLARRAFLGDVLVLFGTQFSLLAIVLFASLYSQNLLGYSPVMSGVAAMAMIVPLMIGAQVAGRWYDRSGVRPPALTGLVIATAGAALWATTLPDISYVHNVPGMVLLGLGLGLVFSPINTDALSRVESRDRPQASGIVQTFRQLGGTLGVAVVGAVIIGQERPALDPVTTAHTTADAMSTGFYVAAAVFAVTVLAAALLVSRRRTTDDVDEPTPAVPAVA